MDDQGWIKQREAPCLPSRIIQEASRSLNEKGFLVGCETSQRKVFLAPLLFQRYSRSIASEYYSLHVWQSGNAYLWILKNFLSITLCTFDITLCTFDITLCTFDKAVMRSCESWVNLEELERLRTNKYLWILEKHQTMRTCESWRTRTSGLTNKCVRVNLEELERLRTNTYLWILEKHQTMRTCESWRTRTSGLKNKCVRVNLEELERLRTNTYLRILEKHQTIRTCESWRTRTSGLTNKCVRVNLEELERLRTNTYLHERVRSPNWRSIGGQVESCTW